MTPQETKKLFMILMVSYPKFYPAEEKEKLRLTIELWTEMLADVPFEVAQIATKKLILESAFPPTISDVRKQIADITADPNDKIDSSTAWGEVMKAIRIYGYPRPKEALESMSPRTRKTVESMGWQEICQADKAGVVRGQFLKMYDTYTQREKQDALLPQSMKTMINQIGQASQKQLMTKGEDK